MDILKISILLLPTLLFANEKPSCIGYNYPVLLDLRCPQNIYAKASFNYWQPSQENMDLGILDHGKTTDLTLTKNITTQVSTSDSFSPISMDFSFTPGFTAALGYQFGSDGWQCTLEYSWLHSTTTNAKTADQFALFNNNSEAILPSWGIFSDSHKAIKYESAYQKWHLKMDLLDFHLGRAYYVGRRLTLLPLYGLRGAFIRQSLDTSYTNGFVDFSLNFPGLVGQGALVENKEVNNSSKSWAIGPKAAIQTNTLLCYGFSLFASTEIDLLYTKYTSLKENISNKGTVVGVIDLIPFTLPISNEENSNASASYLRTHLNLDLGIDWRCYLSCDRAYLTLALGYTFQAFFQQNMFRNNVRQFPSEGNLYMQGLTTTININF